MISKSKRKFTELLEEFPEIDNSIEERVEELITLLSKKKPNFGAQAIKTFCRIRPTEVKNGIFLV